MILILNLIMRGEGYPGSVQPMDELHFSRPGPKIHVAHGAQPGADEQHEWAERSQALLRQAGHSKGAARDALIEMFASEECALSVPELEERLAQRRPVGRASVYRALDVLHGLSLLVRVDIGDGLVRYERAHLTGEDRHHHHMICDDCGQLIAFDDAELETAIHSLSERHGFEAKVHEVTLRGTCGDCR